MRKAIPNTEAEEFVNALMDSLKTRREHVKASRGEIAEMIGVSTSMIQAWENHSIPSNQYFLLKWMYILGFDISNFMSNKNSVFLIPIVKKIRWIKGRFHFDYNNDLDSDTTIFPNYPININIQDYPLEEILNLDTIMDARHGDEYIGYRLNLEESFFSQVNKCLETFVYRKNVKKKYNLQVIGLNMKSRCIEIGILDFDGEKMDANTDYSFLQFVKEIDDDVCYPNNEDAIQKRYDEQMEYMKSEDYVIDDIENSDSDLDYSDGKKIINSFYFRPLYIVLNPYLDFGKNAYEKVGEDKNIAEDILKNGISLEYVSAKKVSASHSRIETPLEEYSLHVLSYPNSDNESH